MAPLFPKSQNLYIMIILKWHIRQLAVNTRNSMNPNSQPPHQPVNLMQPLNSSPQTTVQIRDTAMVFIPETMHMKHNGLEV